MRTYRAFTVVELLVVMAIIMLLIGLLFPAFHGVKRAALKAKDLNQLRNLQLAQTAYMNDHDGAFIDVGLGHGGSDNEEQAWINTLEEYYCNKVVVRSPLDWSPHWPLEEGGEGVPVGEGRYRRTSYGCNNFLSRTYSPWAAIDPSKAADRLGRVPNPASTVHFLHMAMVGEFAGADHTHIENWWHDPARIAITETQLNAVRGSEVADINNVTQQEAAALWEATSNYTFVDGHVETLAFHQVYLDNETNLFDPAQSFKIAQWIDGK